MTLALVTVIGLLSAAMLRPNSPGEAKISRDIVYAEVDGVPLRLDVYRPAGQHFARPGLLVIHGGGWMAGDKAEVNEFATMLARLGYVAFSPNYRLTDGTQNRYPAPLSDVKAAALWMRAHAAEFNADSQRLGVVGFSVGGQLAATLGLEQPGFRCVVDFFGPSDLTAPYDESSAFSGITRAALGPDPAPYRDASPISHVSPSAPPFLLFHGSDDPIIPVDQSRRMRAALRRSGVEARLWEFKGEGHGFVHPATYEQVSQQLLPFLRRHLGK